MRLALLTSTHIRHIFFAEFLRKEHDLVLVVAEEKGNEDQLCGQTQEDTQLLKDHFMLLELEQRDYFGYGASFSKEIPEVIRVKRGEINTPEIANKLREHIIEGIAVFGSGLLNQVILECCPGKVINAHQGLSPYYRGSGTNFWPFVNRELQYVGTTIHYIDPGIDKGRIICHGRPTIERGDSLHRIGCKAVETSACLLCQVFSLLEQGKPLGGIQQWEKGKLYQRKDFNAQAVRKARENIQNGLIDEYVEMVEKGTQPKIQLVELR